MSGNTTTPAGREGSLAAPTRHAIAWRDPDFFDEASLFKELERVYDLCHGCRRCFSLCNAFPLLFDAIDASPTGELDKVEKKVYWEVVDHCYLCDMCYMTKCPYVPPHPWNIDFPHLMLRAKAVKFRKGETRLRDRILSSTDLVGSIAGIPVVVAGRQCRERQRDRSPHARQGAGRSPRGADTRLLQRFRAQPRRARRHARARGEAHARDARSRRAVRDLLLQSQRADIDADLAAVFRHNGIPVTVVPQERCCGMPKLELGDLESIDEAKQVNIPALAALVDQGHDIVAPIPSCVLMFKQELPLLYPGRPAGAEGQGGDVRPVRVPDAAGTRRGCCARISCASSAR